MDDRLMERRRLTLEIEDWGTLTTPDGETIKLNPEVFAVALARMGGHVPAERMAEFATALVVGQTVALLQRESISENLATRPWFVDHSNGRDRQPTAQRRRPGRPRLSLEEQQTRISMVADIEQYAHDKDISLEMASDLKGVPFGTFKEWRKLRGRKSLTVN